MSERECCARGEPPPWNGKNPRGMEDEAIEWNGYVDQMCHRRPSPHILLVKTVCLCFELRPQFVQTNVILIHMFMSFKISEMIKMIFRKFFRNDNDNYKKFKLLSWDSSKLRESFLLINNDFSLWVIILRLNFGI